MTDAAFRDAVLLGICKQSPILKNIETKNLSSQQKQDLISKDHAQSFREFKVIMSKTAVKWVLATGQKMMNINVIPVDNIRITIEPDERICLMENSNDRPKNIFYLVAKNIACDLFLDQLKTLIGTQQESSQPSEIAPEDRIQLESSQSEGPALPVLSVPKTYNLFSQPKTLVAEKLAEGENTNAEEKAAFTDENNVEEKVDENNVEDANAENENDVETEEAEADPSDNMENESVYEDDENELEDASDKESIDIIVSKKRPAEPQIESQPKKRKQTFDINDLFQ